MDLVCVSPARISVEVQNQCGLKCIDCTCIVWIDENSNTFGEFIHAFTVHDWKEKFMFAFEFCLLYCHYTLSSPNTTVVPLKSVPWNCASPFSIFLLRDCSMPILCLTANSDSCKSASRLTMSLLFSCLQPLYAGKVVTWIQPFHENICHLISIQCDSVRGKIPCVLILGQQARIPQPPTGEHSEEEVIDSQSLPLEKSSPSGEAKPLTSGLQAPPVAAGAAMAEAVATGPSSTRSRKAASAGNSSVHLPKRCQRWRATLWHALTPADFRLVHERSTESKQPGWQWD